MQCKELRNQLTDYLRNGLNEPDRSAADAHIAACPECRDEIEGAHEMWNRLGKLPPEQPDSPRLRVRFNEMLAAYREGMEHGRPSHWKGGVRGWLGVWQPLQPAFQIALALLFFIGGLAAAGYFRSGVEGDAVEQLRAELHATRQMVALSLLQQQSATERLRGVSWSNRIEDPGAEVLSALLDVLMSDPNVNVRLASVEALRKFGGSPIVRRGTLQALMRQDNPAVQVALIDLMVELQEKESIDTLRMFAQDFTVHEGVRQRAAWGLEQFQ